MYQGSFTAQAACRNLAVTTTASASITLPGTGSVIRIVNEGPNHAYLSIGSGAQVATVPTTTATFTSTPILAGTDSTFTLPDGNGARLQLSAICGTGTATLDIQVGEGM
jgi:P pilus assembly chaperone PapD